MLGHTGKYRDLDIPFSSNNSARIWCLKFAEGREVEVKVRYYNSRKYLYHLKWNGFYLLPCEQPDGIIDPCSLP